MAGEPLWINASAGVPSYSANELRQAMALGLMYDGRNMGGRQGVRPGGDQLFVSLAVSTITIQPGVACVDPGLSTPQGPYWVAIPVAETQTLSPADATNPRKDIVICRVYDHDEDASGLRLARTEYLVGTPGPSPAEPAVPAGAIKLALIDVPASPGAAVVTDRRPWTVAPGGILPVAADGDLAAGVAGRYRHRLDTGMLERDTGTAWREMSPLAAWKTSDETVNNVTALQDDDHLFVSVKANAVYVVSMHVLYNSNTTADFQHGFTGPAGASFVWSSWGQGLAATTFEGVIKNEGRTLANTNILGGAGLDISARPTGLLITSGTAGTFRYRWAQSTANVSNTIVRAGSYMLLQRVG